MSKFYASFFKNPAKQQYWYQKATEIQEVNFIIN
jgi:hypothetical protein